MANYYNVTAYRNTGFDEMNLPISREILSRTEFKLDGRYVQFNGLAVKRNDIMGLTYLDLPGSVKDLAGTQLNPAGSTGSHGPGGPFYDLENIDYLRISRTGYPGDEDYIDINQQMNNPWLASSKVEVAFYFVTGLQPRARNVTRVFLKLDIWTTLGGKDKITFGNGFKVRGPVTDAEDQKFNTASEPISLIRPLETKNYQKLTSQWNSQADLDLIVSAVDLTTFEEDQTEIPGLTVTGGTETNGLGIIKPSQTSHFYVDIAGNSYNSDFTGIGVYEANNARVKNNLSILFTLGQLSLQDAYTINGQYYNIPTSSNGFIGSLECKQEEYEIQFINTTATYPRKAAYMFKQLILGSDATGAMNIQDVVDLSSNKIITWAIAIPGGSPYARFKDIKNHAWQNDQAVAGNSWRSKSIIMNGASGSFWNNVNNAFSQQNLSRAKEEQKKANFVNDARLVNRGVNLAANTALDIAAIGQSGVSASNILSGGKESNQALRTVAGDVYDIANLGIDVYAEYQSQKFAKQRQNQNQAELNSAIAQQNLVAPTIAVAPTISTLACSRNGFFVYEVNVNDDDKQRLIDFFNRYGYSGLYKPLNWQTIEVKQRVNFVQTENCHIYCDEFPVRVTSQVDEILNRGVFLWSERPNQAAFDDNPDKYKDPVGNTITVDDVKILDQNFGNFITYFDKGDNFYKIFCISNPNIVFDDRYPYEVLRTDAVIKYANFNSFEEMKASLQSGSYELTEVKYGVKSIPYKNDGSVFAVNFAVLANRAPSPRYGPQNFIDGDVVPINS